MTPDNEIALAIERLVAAATALNAAPSPEHVRGLSAARAALSAVIQSAIADARREGREEGYREGSYRSGEGS